MNDPVCPVDGKQLYNNQTICNGCRNRLENALLETGSLWRDLDETLCKQSVIEHNHASTELDPTPTVFHMGASNTGQALRLMLESWCGLVQAGTGHKFTHKPTPVNLAAYLVHHLPWLAVYEAAPDAYTEIMEAYRDVERVIDVDPETRIVGVCGYSPEPGAPACTQVVWAHVKADAVTCRSCGKVWDVKEKRLEAYAEAYATTASATNITRAFRLDGIAVESHRISVWASRGLLTAVTPRRYVVAHVARLVQLSINGVKLTSIEQETQK